MTNNQPSVFTTTYWFQSLYVFELCYWIFELLNRTQCVVLPQNNLVTNSILYAGKRGLFTTTSGLKVVYVSGTEAESDKSSHHTFTKEDIESLRNICVRGQSNFRGVDILITLSWPKDIILGDKSSVSHVLFMLWCMIFYHIVLCHIMCWLPDVHYKCLRKAVVIKEPRASQSWNQGKRLSIYSYV